jgi:energy-coupling factor transporter ATP-binding protein EcfA2
LSRDNVDHLWHLVRYCHALNLPVDLFALEGEDSDRPIGTREYETIDWPDPLTFSLQINRVRLALGTSFNTLYSRTTRVQVEDFSQELRSPCLMVGENGQGKSLVAKVLARAVGFSGQAGIGADAVGARMLFQDVVAQTLLRSYDAIAGSMGTAARPQVASLCREISHAAGSADLRPPDTALPHDTAPLSLTAVKAVLVAARLCAGPGALILDEPDWGMTRSEAAAFVAAVIRSAHARRVPVLIISHKPWWRAIAGSTVAVSRTETLPRGERQTAFRVSLKSIATETE